MDVNNVHNVICSIVFAYSRSKYLTVGVCCMYERKSLFYNSFSQANKSFIMPYYHMQEQVVRSYFYWFKKKTKPPFIYINYKKAQSGSPKSTLKMSCTAYITFNMFTTVHFIIANRSCNTRAKTSTPSRLKLLIKEQNIGNIVLTALWGQQCQDDRLRHLCNIWDIWFRTRD